MDGNASETVNNIVTNERLFRISIVSDLVTFAGVVVLTVALWVLLKPVNRDIALLAAFWRLVESSILCVITLSSFLVLYLSSGAEYLKAIEAGMPTRAFPVCERLGSTTGGGYEVSLGRFRGKAGRCRCPTGFEL